MGLSLVQWNIRGARANSAWLRHSLFCSSDIIALQETFLKPPLVFHIPGKNIFRQDRMLGKGGGLLLGINSRFPSRQLLVPRSSNRNEVLGVEVRLAHNVAIQVFNLYSAPGSIDGLWLEQILDGCRGPFIIVGDFNSVHTSLGGGWDSPQGVTVIDWVIKNELCLINTQTPTHISPNGQSTLIDLSVTSPDLFIGTNYFVHPDPFDSDHLPICLQFKNLNPASHQCITRKRYDWGTAAACLNRQVHKLRNNSYAEFLKVCTDSLKASARNIKITTRAGAPWWDSRCSYLLGEKRKYLRKARRQICPIQWANYKRVSALLRREINDARREYWAYTCKTAAETGSIYRILRSLQSHYAPPRNSYNLISIPSLVSPNSADEANAFADSYSRSSSGGHIPLDFSINSEPSLHRPFDLSELQRALHSSSNRTPGKDGISLRILQSLDSTSLHALLELYNHIWTSGDIPDSWRESVVIPILKPGKNADSPGSYRPISLTSVPSKVFERMLLQRLVLWLLEKDIFNPRHCGFLPFRDCTSALAKLFSDLTGARQHKQFCVLVSLDISAAYDTVWQDGLALKMLTAGIDGQFTWWIHSFMQRNFQVRWKGILSTKREVEVGVPQGAVLSPILFSIYMRDIFEAIGSEVNGLIYADDIFIYCADPSLDRAKTKVQEAIHNIARWCAYWQLKLNPSKSAAMVLSRKRTSPQNQLRILGEEIPWVPTFKILGLTFNRNLSWNSHVKSIRERALKKLNILRGIAHVSRGIPTKYLLQISQMAVVSTLHHGSPIYSFACPSIRKKLEPILNAALRTATGLPRWTPIQILRREANALSVESTHDLQRSCFLVRHLSLGPRSPISQDVQPDNSHDSILAVQIRAILQKLQIAQNDILNWELPSPSVNGNIQFHTDSLKFQDKWLQPELIRQMFSEFVQERADWNLIATDASKSSSGTSIAFWDMTRHCGHSSQASDINSIFTAEALALGLALEFAPISGKLVLLSDSRSVVTSLQTVNHRSPNVILHLYNQLIRAASHLAVIQVIWVPGHKGIHANEMADRMARSHDRSIAPTGWIAPEDICCVLRRQHREEDTLDWIAGKYCNAFSHLNRRSWEHRKLRLPRRGEVLLSRLRTRSLPTRSLLFRFQLCSSPLCPTCKVPETCDHFLTECRQFTTERLLLYRKVGTSSADASLSSLCDLAVSGAFQACCLVSFLLGTCRF